jgi:hypothetical protein
MPPPVPWGQEKEKIYRYLKILPAETFINTEHENIITSLTLFNLLHAN